MRAQAGQGDLGGVKIVEEDLAGFWVVKAEDERENRRFPSAGGADEGDALTGLDVEIDVVEDLRVGPGGVAEVDAMEGECASESDAGLAAGALGGSVEDFAEAVGGSGGLLKLGDDFWK